MRYSAKSYILLVDPPVFRTCLGLRPHHLIPQTLKTSAITDVILPMRPTGYLNPSADSQTIHFRLIAHTVGGESGQLEIRSAVPRDMPETRHRYLDFSNRAHILRVAHAQHTHAI